MTEQARKAILISLLSNLRSEGSWGGETHLQKSVYFLQQLIKVPLDYSFTLYKHGPFSFDLREDLAEMRGEGLIEMERQEPPYGPKLIVTEAGEDYLKHFPKTVARFKERIEFVSRKLGNKSVTELEPVATALFVLNEGVADNSDESRVSRIRDLKPHLTNTEAASALSFVLELISEVGNN